MQGGEEGAAHGLPAMTAVKPGQLRSTSSCHDGWASKEPACGFRTSPPKEDRSPAKDGIASKTTACSQDHTQKLSPGSHQDPSSRTGAHSPGKVRGAGLLSGLRAAFCGRTLGRAECRMPNLGRGRE